MLEVICENVRSVVYLSGHCLTSTLLGLDRAVSGMKGRPCKTIIDEAALGKQHVRLSSQGDEDKQTHM